MQLNVRGITSVLLIFVVFFAVYFVLFVFVLCLVLPMLSVFLDCPFGFL